MYVCGGRKERRRTAGSRLGRLLTLLRKRSKIGVMRLRWTPSGLIMINVVCGRFK